MKNRLHTQSQITFHFLPNSIKNCRCAGMGQKQHPPNTVPSLMLRIHTAPRVYSAPSPVLNSEAPQGCNPLPTTRNMKLFSALQHLFSREHIQAMAVLLYTYKETNNAGLIALQNRFIQSYTQFVSSIMKKRGSQAKI